jgi:hypothetical protein
MIKINVADVAIEFTVLICVKQISQGQNTTLEHSQTSALTIPFSVSADNLIGYTQPQEVALLRL